MSIQRILLFIVSAIGFAVLAFFAWFVWLMCQFHLCGDGITAIDQKFERHFKSALLLRLEQRGKLEIPPRELQTLLYGMLGFEPVTICQNDGADFGGIASEEARKAYQAITKKADLPRSIVKFANVGEDFGGPDFKTTLHFIGPDGVAHARSMDWSSSCQSISQCAPIFAVRVRQIKTGVGSSHLEFLFAGIGKHSCALAPR